MAPMGAVEDASRLGELELFQGLKAEELAELNGLLRSQTVQAGAHFITAEQPGEVVYVLLSGTVKIYVTRADGREVILAFLGPGDTVAIHWQPAAAHPCPDWRLDQDPVQRSTSSRSAVAPLRPAVRRCW